MVERRQTEEVKGKQTEKWWKEDRQRKRLKGRQTEKKIKGKTDREEG